MGRLEDFRRCSFRTSDLALSLTAAFVLIFRQNSGTNVAIANNTAADKVWPPFHFFKNFGDILANDAYGQQVERTKKQNRQNHYRNATGDGRGKEQTANNLCQHGHNSDSKQKQAGNTQHIERYIAEGKNPLLRPADVLPKIVSSRSEHSFGAKVIHANLLETGISPDAAHEQVPFRKTQKSFYHTPVDQRKVSGVVGNPDIGELIEHAVEELVGQLHGQRRLAFHAAAINYVMALAPQRHEVSNQLRRILEVTIQQ